MSEVDRSNWYCIKFDVPRRGGITALEFSRKMNSFLEQIEAFNHSIVNGIDETYTVASYVEDFETGSVKWWLLDKLQKADDKAIDKFVDKPVKMVIAGLLKIAKTKAIDYLQENLSQKDKEIKIVAEITRAIEAKSGELERNALSPDIRPDYNKTLAALTEMSHIANDLDGNVSFIESYEYQNIEKKIAPNFEHVQDDVVGSVGDERNDEKVLSITVVTEPYILLTPTSKDGCMWEFEDGDNKIKCQMSDMQFYNDYINGKIKLGGREKMLLEMRIETKEVNGKYKKTYSIIKVKDLLGEYKAAEL